jgi:hypothetical protein
MKHWLRRQFPPLHWYRGYLVRRKIVISAAESDIMIIELLNKGVPALIGRIGATEAAALSCIQDLKHQGWFPDPLSYLFSKISARRRFMQLCQLAGVYPINKQILDDFYSEWINSIQNSDIFGCWGEAFTSIEHIAYKNEKIQFIRQVATSPWVLDDQNTPGHWSNFLEGKKVLIISPFVDTFIEQIPKAKNIFIGAKFPDFVLLPITAPSTQGGLNDGKTWTMHLNAMKKQMDHIDFDIALISAGAYANPLANHAKILGKIGINCGGELQLFFGVFGKRWEKPGRQHQYLNEFWVRPRLTDRPQIWKEIEGGAYW